MRLRRISHPCLPSNVSNSLALTLYECCDPMDSFEISLFDEVDAFYTCGHDAIMNDAYGDELPIVPHVEHEIVGHEQHDLCDSYILDVVHEATENYFERGKFGCRNFPVTKTPLFMLKVFKLFLFHLPMLVALCFFDLFSYNFPMHRKWVRLKCVSHLLLDALFCFNLYSCKSILHDLQA